MKKRLIPLCLVTTMAHAEDSHIYRNDWEIACDNTRTCRAAGYTDDEAEHPASLLLTRKAGQGQQIKADVRRGDMGGEVRDLPETGALYLNEHYAGPLHFDDDNRARLTPRQTQSVLKAIVGKRSIRMRSGEDDAIISHKGGHAVLVKMDMVQGRLGTPSAVTRRGIKTDVLPALPMPVIVREPLYSLDVAKWNGVIDLAALKKDIIEEGGDACDFEETMGDDVQPTVEAQLTRDALLVSAPCSQTSRSINMSFWRINTQPPHQPEEIAVDVSGFENGDIMADFFERAYGDCLLHSQWSWTGETFVLTSDYDGGMCRKVRPMGAWELPTYVSEVREATNDVPAR